MLTAVAASRLSPASIAVSAVSESRSPPAQDWMPVFSVLISPCRSAARSRLDGRWLRPTSTVMATRTVDRVAVAVRRARSGEHKLELAAGAQAAADPDVTTVGAGDGARERQAKARAAGPRLGGTRAGREPVEDVREFGRR